jgi:hypothetical protein
MKAEQIFECALFILLVLLLSFVVVSETRSERKNIELLAWAQAVT